MPTSLTILLDVVRYRLRKLEMGNLAAAAAIGLTMHLHWSDLAVRVGAATLLNVLVYLNNDYLDVNADLEAPERDRAAGEFLHAHMPEARRVQWLLVAALVAIGIAYNGAHGPGLLLSLTLGGGICLAYSLRLKRMPIADIAAMTAWGVAMPMVGFPLDNALGWLLAVQLGLFSSVFESMQVVRDRAMDAEQGIRTTAVVLGSAGALRLARALMALSACFSAACVHPAVGGLLAIAPLLPLSETNAERDWTRVKALCGIAFLASCALLWAGGESQGLLLQLRGTGGAP